jgi:hypothetical protein
LVGCAAAIRHETDHTGARRLPDLRSGVRDLQAGSLNRVSLAFALTEWPAVGSEDNELDVMMEPEVGHGATKVYPRVKLEAVKLIKERGVGYVQAARDLGVHQSVLRNLVKGFEADPQHSFPGYGR